MNLNHTDPPEIEPVATPTLVRNAPPEVPATPSRTLPFGPQFDVAARSLVGNQLPVRSRNDDNFLLIASDGRAVWLQGNEEVEAVCPDWPSGHLRLALFDGLGGHGLGNQVAQATAAALAKTLPFADVASMIVSMDALHLRLRGEFAARHAAGESRFLPGTTVIVLDIDPTGRALLYHVGDSRLYRIGPADAAPPREIGYSAVDDAGNAVEQLTIDHVDATENTLAGLLSREQWRIQTQLGSGARISQAFVFGRSAMGEVSAGAAQNGQSGEDSGARLRHLLAHELPADLAPLADCREVELRHDSVYLLATDGWWSTPYAEEWFARWPKHLLKWDQTLTGALDDLAIDLLLAPPPELRSDNATAVAIRWRADAPRVSAMPQTDVMSCTDGTLGPPAAPSTIDSAAAQTGRADIISADTLLPNLRGNDATQ